VLGDIHTTLGRFLEELSSLLMESHSECPCKPSSLNANASQALSDQRLAEVRQASEEKLTALNPQPSTPTLAAEMQRALPRS
jgi:hypothetical protein